MDANEFRSSEQKVEDTNVGDAVQKNDRVQTVVADLLNHIIDVVCTESAPALCEFIINPCENIVDTTNYRDVYSKIDDEESSEKTFVIQSSDSSDDEFERILLSTHCDRLMRQQDVDDDLEAHSTRPSTAVIEHEYDILPAIEELKIHVEDDIPLEQFGNVVNIIDRLVVIESNSNVALDLDTVVFDEQRNAVGQIFDIFGPVAKPMYSILFNSIEKANEWKVGNGMFYAPNTANFTHTVFTEKLKKEKGTDSPWEGESESMDFVPDFSDDEAEARYKAKQRNKDAKKRGQRFQDDPSSKRARHVHIYDRSRGRRSMTQQLWNEPQCNHYYADDAFNYQEWEPNYQAPCWPPSGNISRYRPNYSTPLHWSAVRHLRSLPGRDFGQHSSYPNPRDEEWPYHFERGT